MHHKPSPVVAELKRSFSPFILKLSGSADIANQQLAKNLIRYNVG